MKDAYAAKSLKRITQFLDEPDFDGFTTEDLFIKQFVPKGWGQDIAALSNMAEVIRNLCRRGKVAQSNAAMYMNKIYQCAISPSVRPWKKPISADTNFWWPWIFSRAPQYHPRMLSRSSTIAIWS